jgi:hypothetical protein
MTKHYDSCVFGNASNATHAHHEGCLRSTSVEHIDWPVSLCTELVFAELPSAEEYVKNFLVYCVVSGVLVLDCALSDCKQEAKRRRAHKKPLTQLGFQGHDWNHLMAASHNVAVQILTTDQDFFDPANKALAPGSRMGHRVKDYISDNFGIEVAFP